MRYASLTALLLAAAMAGVQSLSAQEAEVPAGVRGLRAPQVVGRILDLRADLRLSEAQVGRLNALEARFRSERSPLTPGPRSLHPVARPRTGGTVAYLNAAALLTPEQQVTAFRLLDRSPGRTTTAAVSDPLVHHAAGVKATSAVRGRSGRVDPLLHPTGTAPAERPQAARKAMNPVTHQE